jgi:hypothetical protein
MTPRRRLTLVFTAVGFFGALVSGAFLWFFVGPQYSYAVLGFREAWLFATFPFIGALLAAAWSACFDTTSFGAPHGAVVALLSFLTFCALLSGLGPFGAWGFFAFAFFGFLLFGWALVLLGAFAGFRYRRSASGAL